MTNVQSASLKIDNRQQAIDKQQAANGFSAATPKPEVKIAYVQVAFRAAQFLAQNWPAICFAVGAAGTAWQYKDDLAKIISGTKVPYNKTLSNIISKILASPIAKTMPEDWQKNMQNYVMQMNNSGGSGSSGGTPAPQGGGSNNNNEPPEDKIKRLTAEKDKILGGRDRLRDTSITPEQMREINRLDNEIVQTQVDATKAAGAKNRADFNQKVKIQRGFYDDAAELNSRAAQRTNKIDQAHKATQQRQLERGDYSQTEGN